MCQYRNAAVKQCNNRPPLAFVPALEALEARLAALEPAQRLPLPPWLLPASPILTLLLPSDASPEERGPPSGPALGPCLRLPRARWLPDSGWPCRAKRLNSLLIRKHSLDSLFIFPSLCLWRRMRTTASCLTTNTYTFKKSILVCREKLVFAPCGAFIYIAVKLGNFTRRSEHRKNWNNHRYNNSYFRVANVKIIHGFHLVLIAK